MRIYVAGRNIPRALAVMDALKGRGHEITYDWASDYSEDDQAAKARAELEGVRACDLLIYLWEPDQVSARYEAGMAMGLGRAIFVSGGPGAFFHLLPGISLFGDDQQMLAAFESATSHQPELPDPRVDDAVSRNLQKEVGEAAATMLQVIDLYGERDWTPRALQDETARQGGRAWSSSVISLAYLRLLRRGLVQEAALC